MSILGVDYGNKRIGVAVSDPGLTMAHPLRTILVKPDGSHMDEIREAARAYNADRIVVGLPYNMDGSLGFKGQEVMLWGGKLEEMTGLPVIYWDERLSTSEAHGILLGFNVKGKKRRAVVDKIAASIILQGYLDSEHS